MEISPEEYDRLRQAGTERQRGSNAPAVAMAIVVALVGAALVIPYLWDKYGGKALGDIKIIATNTATTRTFPTMDTAARDLAAQRAAQTAAEEQALKNALPTEDASKPPALPEAATAAAGTQGGLATAVPATSFSPIDTGYRPVPTPTTMLPQEQFDASMASEEQNQLNTQLSGLTPAQQMVRVHDAEYAASSP